MEQDLLAVGHISKAHGVRGEVVCILQAERPDLLDGTIFLCPRNGGAIRAYTVRSRRCHHGAMLLCLEGVNDRNEAELLRSHTVLVSRDKLPPLEEGEVYLQDLIGLRVLCPAETASGTEAAAKERDLGRITAADAPAGQILWTITTEDGQEILFPAVEEFVLDINLEEGCARIAPPPGLLDLYLA